MSDTAEIYYRREIKRLEAELTELKDVKKEKYEIETQLLVAQDQVNELNIENARLRGIIERAKSVLDAGMVTKGKEILNEVDK